MDKCLENKNASIKRLNCWEVMECGRERGGKNIAEFGVCPAADDHSYNGINSGKFGGRICWAVEGTLCGNCIQGSFVDKRSDCLNCSFYQMVQEQERIPANKTKFLHFINQEDRSPFFDKMTRMTIKAGERFVVQGAIEDRAYIIEQGACLVIVEKDGALHPVDHYGEGEIVGGLGILTGEPRRAHVEAETDMVVWVMTRAQFEEVVDKDPDLLNFITELVADRLDSRRPIAYRTIGKYVTTDIIGRGAFSIVYKGVHKNLNMPVTIKMMRHDMALQPDFFESFYEEAKIVAALSHENIVRVYDFEERHRTLFIIMEYLNGDSLKEMTRRLRHVPPQLAVYYLFQICSALEYAHRRGIIHRDINPSNIMIQPDDVVKILDFGLACQVGTEDFSNPGTLYYMAPEQITGDPVDARTDIYALAITAFEMVTGRRPLEENCAKTLMERHLNRDAVVPSDLNDTIPFELRNFILKCGRKDPAERFQNMREVITALRLLMDETIIFNPKSTKARINKASLSLAYTDENRSALNRLVEAFKSKAGKIGVEVELSELS